MNPNDFRTAASELLGVTAVNSAEIEIGQMRELLGMRGKPNMPRELWAETMGLRVVATRSARKGKNAWVRVGDVCRALEDEGGQLSVAVKKSAGRFRVLARTNGQAVQMSEPEPTPDPEIVGIETATAEDIAFARQQALYKRLDAMATRLDTLQNFAYANSKRLRCLGRKLDAIVKAWDITVPPYESTGDSELDDILDTFTFTEDD